MKTKSLIIVFAVIALVGGFAVRATRDADQTKVAIRVLASQRTTFRTSTAAMAQRLRTANEALAQLEQKTGQPPEEPGASVGAPATIAGEETAARPAIRIQGCTLEIIIANDPQKMAKYAKEYRDWLDLPYGGMFKALGFSAEQAEKFKDLKVWVELQTMDLEAVAEKQGLDRNSDAFRKLQAAQAKTRKTKEAELLGDLGAPYREYIRTEKVRNLALELTRTAAFSGEPVTFAQVERATQVLATNSQRQQKGQPSPNFVIPNTVNWAAASAQLQGVLSPSQIATLGSIIQRDATQAKVDELQARLTAEFKARLPTP